MRYKFSRCFALEHPKADELIAFYRDKIGLEVIESTSEQITFEASPVRLFANRGGQLQSALIFELIVEDLEKAREDLIAKGCEVVRWDGKGKACYVRDPFGLMFNVWEDPSAFEG